MIEQKVKEINLKFNTNEKIFSPNKVDTGTLAMLSQIEFSEDDKILDLGCGYGIIGILASKLIGVENIIMCDISDDAITLSKENAKLNGVEGVEIIKSDGLDEIRDSDFTLILSNPPYHADFSVPKRFIEEGYKRLVFGGRMLMVTKRKDWYKNKFISIFGGVKIIEQDDYFVFIAEKRDIIKKKKVKDKNKLSRKLQRKKDRNK